MGNSEEAARRATRVICPTCRTADAIVRRGAEWFCEPCQYTWFAYTEKDKVALKVNRIANDEEPE